MWIGRLGTSGPDIVSLRDLLDRHLVFVGGKGGVGKTTTAAALGLEAARRGRRCLLVSTDPAHSLGDIFDARIGDTRTRLADDLWGLEIDPDHEAARHIQQVKTQMKTLVHPRLYDEVDRQLDLARDAPGASEAALLERVAELMGESGSDYDVVIFDTAPSGHTVRLLSLPEIMSAWTDGLLRHRRRAGTLSSALRHLGGGRVSGDDLSLIDAAQDDAPDSASHRINDVLQARRRKFLVARDRLLDQTQTAFLLVLNPDKLSILESRRVVDLLGRFRIEVFGLVLNRVLPPGTAGQPANDYLEARRRQEDAYRREILETFPGLPRLEIPLLPHDVHGLAALREVGQVLSEAWGGTPA